MMRCEKCGKEIPDNSQFCLNCGSPLSNSVTDNENKDVKRKVNIKSNLGLMILSCLVPFLGLWFFGTYWKDDPEAAKLSGLAALVGKMINLAISCVFIVVLLYIAFNALTWFTPTFN